MSLNKNFKYLAKERLLIRIAKYNIFDYTYKQILWKSCTDTVLINIRVIRWTRSCVCWCCTGYLKGNLAILNNFQPNEIQHPTGSIKRRQTDHLATALACKWPPGAQACVTLANHKMLMFHGTR